MYFFDSSHLKKHSQNIKITCLHDRVVTAQNHNCVFVKYQDDLTPIFCFLWSKSVDELADSAFSL